MSTEAPPPHELVALARLADAIGEFSPAAFSCSFGLEDMVILDLIARHRLPAEVFTLDTGRLHEETHSLIAEAHGRYGLPIRVLFPQAAALESLIRRDGPNGFYASVEARKACCAVRKVEPLGRALAGKRLWITGLRRGQAVTRSDVLVLERDDGHGLFKLNPLADWSEAQVLDYIERHRVPVNALHARGFPSIGCAPCTRAVAAGEDPRAGRWWWETPEQKECGLHVAPDGRLVRAAGKSTATAGATTTAGKTAAETATTTAFAAEPATAPHR